MIINLTPEQEKFVFEQMRVKGHTSPESVISEGLMLIQERDEYHRRMAALRAELNIGAEQIRRGQVVDGPTAIQSIRDKLKQRQTGST